jgi:hypothetical protein
MTKILDVLIKVYGFLLRLYPAAFRREFREQMLLDFSDLAKDAVSRGKFFLIRFCMWEVIDFPVNLLRVYLKEGSVFKILRSQPIHHALRGALGYGVAFGLAILIGEFVGLKLSIADNSIIGILQVFYFDMFHTEHGLELISWIPHVIASLLTGLVLGILFAAFFAGRSNYRRYVLAGMLCWFLHDAITSILWQSANLGFFLGTKHTIYLSITESVLSGAFLASTFVIAKSEKREPMRWLVIGSLVYPLIAYFYLQLLFKLGWIETPWMFIALMIVYIGSVFVMALRSGVERRTIWILTVGAIGYPLLGYLGFYLTYLLSLLIGSLTFPMQAPVGSSLHWQLIFRIALEQSIYGILFGILIGLALGFQKKSVPPQLTTNT